MKRVFLSILIASVLLILSVPADANSRNQLVQYIPRNSHLVGGADFVQLQENEVYRSMERNGQIWSYDDGKKGIVEYIQILKLDTKKDIQSFAFANYVNNYGGSGRVHVFQLNPGWKENLQQYPSSSYLGISIHRLTTDRDMQAAMIGPSTLAVGNLNEVKMAIDVAKGKLPAMGQNQSLAALYSKIPEDSAIWAVAMPLPRRKAADSNAKQSTNAIISGFESYYFYGVPTRTSTRTQFFGNAPDDKQAAFMSSFMIGTLLVTKFRVEPPLAEMLDQINIKHQGKTVHVSMVVTKEMVDAYFQGKLGF
jgi:hypothetical protein